MGKQWRFVRISILVPFLALAAGPGTLRAGPQDFDGDGYADLAMGVPYENVGSATDAGSVSVAYGTLDGLRGAGNEDWQQNDLDGSDAEPFEYFGIALAVGDFDGDGYFDLAVGVSHEDVGSVGQAGAVNVIYGGELGGLDVAGNQYWNQNEDDMADDAEEDDHFGSALAAGDFDGDGYDDLAIGVPEEDIGSVVDAGAVQVMYGSAGGLTAAEDKIWDQGAGVEASDGYGAAVAAGDFDNDGYDDLAVGVPDEDLVDITDSGAVEIYYGSAGGLTTRLSNDFWHQGRTGIAGEAEEYDFFGSSLTVGDFDGDGYDDLAIGVPYEDAGSPEVTNAGAVNVLYGSAEGITASGSDFWHQNIGNIGSLCEEDDRFGFALTAGDFDGDGRDDLAVGVPYEHWEDPDTGIVQVLYGTADGLDDAGTQLWRQDISGVNETEEPDDRYGYALAAGDFDGDGYVELVIGVPYESIGTVAEAGAANVLYGSASGLTADNDQLWYQGNILGLQGTPEVGDRLGYALAAIPRARQGVYLPLLSRE